MSRCLLLLILAALGFGCSESSEVPHYGVEGGQWRSYGGDPGSAKYSPLDQIDAGNVDQLEVAWSWVSADVEWKRDIAARKKAGQKFPYTISSTVVISDFQVTPLYVDGVLYGTTSAGRVFALDAGSGRTRWIYDPESYRSSHGMLAFYWPKHRGVTYWRSGDDERIFVPAIDSYLIALDARTGQPVRDFGTGGRVDLLAGLRGPKIDRLAGYFQSSPVAVYRDTIIVGSSISDRPASRTHTPGDVRGYDARTGALRWTFHTIPAEGEFGADTWEDEAWRYTGAANAWGPMSVDDELGAVYIATSTPTNDFYGGHRLGDGLFAETLLCLDAETGQRRWHFQMIHHGLWDYDPGAAPNLVDIEVEGRPVRAVAQVTKQGHTFVFDRESGEPVWPIEERPVPASDVPGEVAAATQPFPTKPPPFEKQGFGVDDVIDFTPELHAEGMEVFGRHDSGPLFTPPSLRATLILPGPPGGANWRGAGFDRETGVLYVPSVSIATAVGVKPGDPSKTDLRFVAGTVNPQFVPGGNWSEGALPLNKPPYSRISAIDLNRGEILWQVANGDGPRDHPRLAGLDLPPLGTGGPTGVLVTKTLVFAGEGAELFVPSLGGTRFHSYDKTTGAVVSAREMGAKIRGVPMTYIHEGRQYIVMAIADRDVDPQLVALALPENVAAEAVTE